MKEINIKADLWRLSPDWAVAGTRGSFGSCTLTFEFSPHWERLCRRITFFPSGEKDGISILMSGSSVRVPDEVMARAGTAVFVLDGVGEDGVALVSTRGELRIIDTASPGGSEPNEYAPSVLDQLRLEIDSLRREVKALKKEAV